jgi:hypothetical protein
MLWALIEVRDLKGGSCRKCLKSRLFRSENVGQEVDKSQWFGPDAHCRGAVSGNLVIFWLMSQVFWYHKHLGDTYVICSEKAGCE